MTVSELEQLINGVNTDFNPYRRIERKAEIIDGNLDSLETSTLLDIDVYDDYVDAENVLTLLAQYGI